jgi:hypothetical protein
MTRSMGIRRRLPKLSAVLIKTPLVKYRVSVSNIGETTQLIYYDSYFDSVSSLSYFSIELVIYPSAEGVYPSLI